MHQFRASGASRALQGLVGAMLAALLLLTTACTGPYGIGGFDRITVQVYGSGTGSGTVEASDPAVQLNCSITPGLPPGVVGGGCEDTFDDAGAGGSFELTAIPNAGSLFNSWTNCSAVSGAVCTLSFSPASGDTAFSVTATFSLSPPPPAACTNSTKTWTGTTVSNDWSNPANWNPAGVPGQTDDVCVPASSQPFSGPRLSANAAVRNLVGLVGTDLSGLFNLDIHGDLNWAGTIAPGSFGEVRLIGAPGTVHTVQGNMTPLTVEGDYTVAGPLTVATQLKIEPGRLTLGGNTVSVGQLEVGSTSALAARTGRLVMTNPLDAVLTTGVSASVFFNSDVDHNLLLTAGVLRVGGNFEQLFGAPFAASGTHRTVFTTGSTFPTHTVRLLVPQASFQDLDVSAAGTVNIEGNPIVQGQLIATPQGATPYLEHTTAGVRLLTVGGVNVTGLNLGRLRLLINGGNITAFRNVQFGNFQDLGGSRLEVRNPGSVGPFVFDNLSFADVPPAGGFYLSADGPFTITVINSSPATGTPFVQVTNGAVVNW